MYKYILKLGYFIFLNTIFVSSHMYSEGTVILGSMNMGYDIYPTLPGIKSSCNLVPSKAQFDFARPHYKCGAMPDVPHKVWLHTAQGCNH